jgi:hypothetical protein
MIGKNKKAPELEPIPKNIMNIVWILVLGAIMPLLNSTMVNIAIKHLSNDFSTGLDSIQWIITGYVLAMAVSVPLVGWMVQRFNGKWLMISANIVFLVTSILRTLLEYQFFDYIPYCSRFQCRLYYDTGDYFGYRSCGNERMGRVCPPLVFHHLRSNLWSSNRGLDCPILVMALHFLINIPVGILAIILMILKYLTSLPQM